GAGAGAAGARVRFSYAAGCCYSSANRAGFIGKLMQELMGDMRKDGDFVGQPGGHTPLFRFALATAALILAGPISAQTPEAAAEAALRAAPVWDGHNDVPIQLRSRYRNVLAE